MPKIDLDAIPQANRTGYPPPYDQDVQGRWVRRLAPVAGLSDMGASHVVLKPGAWTSQRHWHAEEDELLVILSGEAVLVEDDGETVLHAGDIGQRGDHCRDRAFHVHGAPPVQHSAARFRRERFAAPALARGDDVEMPGEREVPAARRAAANGEAILDVPASNEAMHLEPERRDHRLERVEHRPARRSDAFAGDQPFGEAGDIAGVPHRKRGRRGAGR